MKKILLTLPLFFLGCSVEKIVYKEVLIPTKCEIPEREKPKRENYIDYTEFQAYLRAYYKNIESDLYFCRTGKRLDSKLDSKEDKNIESKKDSKISSKAPP